jgi:hypothetical protein
LDDFHISDANIYFALVQEVDVKASQTISASFLLVQQVSMIQDLGYVSAKHHGDYVLKINMGIKQDHMPSVPSKLDLVGVSPPKDSIHGSIIWSNTSIDENTTIDLIVNAMTLTEVVLNILQQYPMNLP